MTFTAVSVGNWWPLLPALAGLAFVAWRMLRPTTGALFPDLSLVRGGAFTGRLPLWTGLLAGLLLMAALMNVEAIRVIEEERRARDFLLIVDTSRSMRENTSVRRDDYPPSFERRADLFVGQSADPARIPWLARYEVARESLLQYLDTRGGVDRVGLIYFNSMVYLMSGFTGNLDFIRDQLGSMDPYVTFGTNIRWALEQALDLVERYPGNNRRAIVLITDAEARHTDYLQQQLDRLRKADVAFYLLWIMPEGQGNGAPLATAFLRQVRSIGSVYTISNLGDGFLDDALLDIAQLEDYAYRESGHERVDLSALFGRIAAWLCLVWILMMGTAWLPRRGIVDAEGRLHCD